MSSLQDPQTSSPAEGDQETVLAPGPAPSPIPGPAPAPAPTRKAYISPSESPERTSVQSTSLTAHKDARALVRLIQCSQCSYPLRTPVTLPCGNSLCKQCLPPSHQRDHISYPIIPSRLTCITCPFPYCQQIHALDDCSVSVALYKIVDSISANIARARENPGERQTSIEEVMHILETSEQIESSNQDLREKGHARTLSGGRLVATFAFAEMGELPYTSDAIYHQSEEDPSLDMEILDKIKDDCIKEADCHVCYNMMLDPVTAPCGHTFCRKCLARVLDHSPLCPHCRRSLPLPPSLRHQKSNVYLTKLLGSLCAEQVTARAEASELEEQTAAGGLDTSLFICTVSLPQMPMILHIFEPRYRLMVRRAFESTRQFGMLAYNEHRTPQGNLGMVQFMETGIMLYIEQCRFLPDGRSWLLCRGISRFKVAEYGTMDGYVIGRVERHSDISLAEEERLEAEETSAPEPEPSDAPPQLDRMATADLLAIGLNFVRRAEEQSATWLTGTIRDIYGGPPDDAAVFPYWFGSVAPLPDEEKYKLMPTTSVRERLKIVAGWVRRIEAQRW